MSALKDLAQTLIMNEKKCQVINKQLKGLKDEQKDIKGKIDGLMVEQNIDVLHKNGSKIERKEQQRKAGMNKVYVEETLTTYMTPDQLQAAMNKLYDARPKTTTHTIKCTVPKQTDAIPNVMPEESSDLENLQNQFFG